ncbi:unnamed protein product [Cochlearia groenlandica]
MVLRRPISSPGRVEKYPAALFGLMRRSKSRSASTSRSLRSKGRSRASPLFIRRNKSTALVTQEPSSPKVSCMGQVRIERSKPKFQTQEDPPKRPCDWIPKASFSHNGFARKFKSASFLPKWSWFSSPFSQTKSVKVKDSPSTQLDRPAKESALEIEEEEDKTPKFIATTPPINALMLTRSRSAPYGSSSSSSSLAFRFWEEDNQRQAAESPNEEINESEICLEAELNESGLIGRPEFTRSKSEPSQGKGARRWLGLSRD